MVARVQMILIIFQVSLHKPFVDQLVRMALPTVTESASEPGHEDTISMKAVQVQVISLSRYRFRAHALPVAIDKVT